MIENRAADKRNTRFLTTAVFLVSAALLGLELVLMRCLAVSSYHHFSYLVISTALLGFGSSGTFLFLFKHLLLKRFWRNASFASALFSGSLLLCFRAAQSLPLDVQYIFFDFRQALLLLFYHFLLFLPFFFGALVIGLSLFCFSETVHRVYAANLFGSGAGTAGMLALLFFLAPQDTLYFISALGIIAGLLFAIGEKESGSHQTPQIPFYSSLFINLITLFVLIFPGILSPLELRIDSYKALVQMRHLENQGEANHVCVRYGPRARLDVYDSKRLHQTLFVSLAADTSPPPQLLLLSDGSSLATVFKIDSPHQADIMQFTPSQVAYRLAKPGRVLLLGETGGPNVWLAQIHGAREITVVQPDPRIFHLIKNELKAPSGDVFGAENVRLVNTEPRTFLEKRDARPDSLFDLIQIVSLETPAAGVTGIQSLYENYLMTVEGIGKALSHLAPGGVLIITRGLQSPPRDNIKILSTGIEALEKYQGVKFASVKDRVIMLRNYLAASTILSVSAFSEDQLKTLQDCCEEMMMDIVWVPDIRSDLLNRYDVRKGPPGKHYSYYHYAARSLMEGRREDFYHDWAYHVRPATDERPYFYNFFKWRTLPRLIRAYRASGASGLQRLELGYIFLVLAFLESIVIAALLILVPLRFTRGKGSSASSKITILIYFSFLGFSYIMLEMVFIQKYVLFLGDPIYAAAVVLSGFMIFSGLGSLTSRRGKASLINRLRRNVVGIIILGLMYLVGLAPLFRILAGLPFALRFFISLVSIFPLSFLMGRPFPLGIMILTRGEAGSSGLVPLAWGVNGFCSVIAASGGIIIAMSFGFSAVVALSLALYGLAVFMIGTKIA